VRSLLVALKPKIDPCQLAADLLTQADTGRQVFGCGQSGENNGLVGEITILILGVDQLRPGVFQLGSVGLNLTFQFLISDHSAPRAGAERPIERIQPRQKSSLEFALNNGIRVGSIHIFGIGAKPRADALAFVALVHRQTVVGVPDQTGEEIVEGTGAIGKFAGYLSFSSDGHAGGDKLMRPVPKFRSDDGR
jgi:hypothetical protein